MYDSLSCRIRLSFFPALSFSVWRFLSSLSVDVRTPSKQTELDRVECTADIQEDCQTVITCVHMLLSVVDKGGECRLG